MTRHAGRRRAIMGAMAHAPARCRRSVPVRSSGRISDQTGATKLPLVLGGVAVVVVVGALLFWFLRDDAPERVNLEDAVATVTTEPGDADADDTGDEPSDPNGDPSAAGIEGEWVVDTETGEFDYESATGSFVGFRVDEELAGIGETEAVGRTGEVSGTMTIEGTTVTAASFEVDMTTLTTNDSRRDDRVQSALATGEFPTASFTLTEPIELPAGAADGDAVQATAVGDLTVKGATNPVELALEAQLVDGTVVVVGSVEVTFSEWGVEVPSAPIVLSAADVGTMELQLLLVRA
jgi:polyisoprenoid-binding protein YceI